MSEPRFNAAAATDVGRVRGNNEDTPLLADDLFAVADGMGGHRGGEVASQLAVASLRANFVDRTVDGLVDAVEQANASVFQQASDDPDLRGMGTTLVVLAVVDSADDAGAPELGWTNVGDSRIYLLRDGEFSQLSEDHSLVEEMVRDGQLSPDEAATHPRRHIVTRALGIDPAVRVDSGTVIPYAGDRFMLCSDGLYEEVDDNRIAATLRKLAGPEDAARELVRIAVEGGGRDNVTVVVVDVLDDDGRAAAASAALAGDVDPAGFSVATAAAADGGRDTMALPKVAAAKAKPPKQRPARPRRLTWRVLTFFVLFVVVLGAAAGAVGWYARRTYYVGFSGDSVVIFKGRPGGVLWFDPTLEDTTEIDRAEVPPARLNELEDGVTQSSRDAADRYVANLEDQIEPTTGTTTSSTTSTTTASTTSTSTP